MSSSLNRAQLHQDSAEKAKAEATRLWEQRAAMGSHWFNWVATELYLLKPAPYASMVRRELERIANE